MLLTDRVRSRGAILANTRHGSRRARFTVAHELGHFLLERHELSGETGFLCQAVDLRETRQTRHHQRQESEANRFAADLLAPARYVADLLSHDPDLREAQRIRDALDISLEVSVRRLVEVRDEALAAVWSLHGQVRYVVRSFGFPFVTLQKGDPVPKTTAAHRAGRNGSTGFTEMVETHSMAWTGQSELDMWEQTRVGQNGHAVTLLQVELTEEGSDNGHGTDPNMPGFR
nr:ImmA/IrrE family metallo-endopeptidase [Oceanicola sp. 502str15]